MEEKFLIHSYPKVYAIGHAAVADLFNGPVLVEEKIDGSQFSFGRIGDQLFMRSRSCEIVPDAPEKMFQLAVDTVKELAPSLHEGWVYRAEYLQKPHHNALSYSRVPAKHLILFDVNTGNEVYLSRANKEAEAQSLGLEIVPTLYTGEITEPKILLDMLETESCLGGQKIEGVVVKNYALFGKDKKVLMGKYVSEAFKEVHAREWKANNPDAGGVIEKLILSLRSPARWEKAVYRLRDAGLLQNAPQDIGALIKEVQKDVKEEELEFISKKLVEWALPRILRSCSAGLPEWYKKRLLESAFKQ